LEGVVSNVANFGAFIDIGVHQDGLVHVSALADRFVKDPRDVVRVGQTVQVRVLEVDVARKRIDLTLRKDDTATERHGGAKPSGRPAEGRRGGRGERPSAAPQGAMAEAFARLQGKG